MLTPEELESYRANGFLLMGRVLDENHLESLRAEEARFRALPQLSLQDNKTVIPDTSTIFRNQLANFSEPIRTLFLGGVHIEVVAQILGPIVCGAFTQFVTKMPDPDVVGGLFPWHQDNGYGDKRSELHVTVWCALDDVDESNGCVWVVPKSHKQGLLPHGESGNSWHLSVDVAGDGIPVRLKAGEAVAFSGFMLHRSLANRTVKPRRAFFMEYGDYISEVPEGEPYTSGPLWLVRGELPR